MAIISETAVTLRIRGDDLIPSEITNALGKNPSLSAEKGGIWFTPKGKSVVAKTGFWHLYTDRLRPGDFDKQIADLLECVSSDLDIWSILSKRFHAELFCGAFLTDSNEGTGLSADTMMALAQRGLHFELDIYAMGTED